MMIETSHGVEQSGWGYIRNE